MGSLVKIDDVKIGLPARLVEMLEVNNVDLPTWEAVKFYYDNEIWGSFVVLTSDAEDNLRQGKYINILGKNMFSVDNYVREELAGQ